MSASTPERLFSDLLASSPSQPFVTYYDEASGERAELSVKSLANWVAKTHHLLSTELGLGLGDHALIALPAHWLSVAPILGCLTAGLEITEDGGEAEVAFVAPHGLALAASAPDIYAIAPDSAATGFNGNEPAGCNDFVLAVRPQEDKWPSVRLNGSPNDPCLAGRTRGEVVEWAQKRAAALGLATGGRLLTTREWTTVVDLVDAVLAPLAVGGSVVIVRNADEPTVQRRIEQERATVRI
jgi:uncharacterized protein (TIGR03089 family)